MSDKDPLYLMLGEIRGDLKWLVQERQTSNSRMDRMEDDLSEKLAAQEKRVRGLEAFRVRIAAFVTALGVLVPTAITITAKKFGLL